jgi:hypothetical protein
MIPPQDGASTRSFLTTPWSLLFALSEDRETTHSDREYMQLLSIYWRPIRSFIAAHGSGSSETSEMAKRFIVFLVDDGSPSVNELFEVKIAAVVGSD